MKHGSVAKLRTTPSQSARSGCQLSQRESQGHFVPTGRQIGAPYELRDFYMIPFNKPLSCMSFGRLRASPTGRVPICNRS